VSIGKLYSLDNDKKIPFDDDDCDAKLIKLLCVSNYPAELKDYENIFNRYMGSREVGISDHTTNWDLFNKYKPEIYECHYKLDDSTGLDAGDFARTPEQLSQIL
jgi:sialic acid synthase SpsE